MAQIHCRECGKKISETAASCPHCGARQTARKMQEVKEVKWSTALLLAIFLGMFGADRFYMGKTGHGIIKLLTFGVAGIWWVIDIILIATKKVEGVEFVD